ncbi:MAG: hypothetical protein IT583_03675 [Verrucomicrobia bacterium]|nr:hypothetical protein [Verrucomicrobiota bacterium]
MREAGQSRVVGLLGVGFDAQDGQIRITQADQFQVLMGSGETHTELQTICRRIEEAIKKTGRSLNEYSPEEFMDLVQKLY